MSHHIKYVHKVPRNILYKCVLAHQITSNLLVNISTKPLILSPSIHYNFYMVLKLIMFEDFCITMFKRGLRRKGGASGEQGRATNPFQEVGGVIQVRDGSEMLSVPCLNFYLYILW